MEWYSSFKAEEEKKRRRRRRIRKDGSNTKDMKLQLKPEFMVSAPFSHFSAGERKIWGRSYVS